MNTNIAVLGALFAAFAAAIGGAYPAIENMVSLWLTTDTYMHGAAILPLSLYLFKQMPSPDTLPKRASWITMIGLSLLWAVGYFLAHLTKVNLLQQIAVIGLIPVTFVCLFGWRYAWHYRTPLMLSFLCIPVGDFLIPYLQTFTADMSVFMLQLSGVTVLHNGWYIRIAAADFRVAEACSGINFLISTFAVSCFYAFLFMSKPYKRALFIALGVIVPILANGVRVYMIIMIAELGNVEAATGVDHLVYGWIFFVVVLIILFAIGHFLQDPEPAQNENGLIVSWKRALRQAGAAPSLIITALAVMGSIGAQTLSPANYQILTQKHGYNKSDVASLLAPQFPRADISETWLLNGWMLHRFSYQDENALKKIVGYENHLFNKERWSIRDKTTHYLIPKLPVRRLTLIDANGQTGTLVLTYCTNNTFAATPLEFKKLQLMTRLLERQDGGVALLFFKLGEHEVTSLTPPALVHACQSL